jgi:glycosyltransferase involved in cell wall biosynthesis
MKVLVLTSTFPRWKDDTTPSFVYDLCVGLKKSGLDIIVLAPHHFGSKLFESIEGLKIYRFPYFLPYKYQRLAYNGGIHSNLKRYKLAKVQVPFFLFFELIYAGWLIKKEQIQIIHSHWILPSGLIGFIFGKLFGIKLITTAHAGDVFTIRKSTILKRIASIVLNNVEIITANSDYTRDIILLINGNLCKKVDVIPMGVDVVRFNPTNLSDLKRRFEASHIILSVGRLVDKKGIEYLIKSMINIKTIFPGAKLIIGGTGPEKDNLIKLSNELKLDDRICFVDRIANSELPLYYASSDVFVLPSIETKSGDTEGLGVVLLEAMASGTPVIGSDIGGITDIIIHGKNGFLTEPKNPKDIADKIINILSNEQQRKSFSEEGLISVNEKFSWDIVNRKFLKAYRRLNG